MQTLAEVVRLTSEGLGEADFVVVFGSRARQSIADESDVGLCLEASWVSDDPELMPRIRERQDQLVFDLVALPRGMLLARLRTGDDAARAIVRDGRVYSDTGSYREVAIAADEEGLE